LLELKVLNCCEDFPSTNGFGVFSSLFLFLLHFNDFLAVLLFSVFLRNVMRGVFSQNASFCMLLSLLGYFYVFASFSVSWQLVGLNANGCLRDAKIH